PSRQWLRRRYAMIAVCLEGWKARGGTPLHTAFPLVRTCMARPGPRLSMRWVRGIVAYRHLQGISRMRRLVLIAGLCLSATALAGQVQVLTAARIHTSDPRQPVAEALAWDESGRVLAVGSA